MPQTSPVPFPYQPGDAAAAAAGIGSRPRTLTAGLVATLAVLLGSAAVGLAAGLAWAQLAPQVAYVVVGGGSANVINPETTAFIAGDAWYCLVAVGGGLLIGVLGYALAVRRYGPAPMAGVLAGSTAAAYAARWTGQNAGLAQFNRQLLTSRPGTVLHAPLTLGGQSPMAFWPLAACLAAGGLALAGALRARSAGLRANPYSGDHRAT
jgi:hypothetical protein